MKKLCIIISLLICLFLVSCGKEKEEIKYTLNLDLNGGELVVDAPLSYNVLEGTSITLPSAKKDGFDFIGWEGEGKLYNDKITVNSNITLKAKWEELLSDTHTISYVLNGGVLASDAKYEYTYPSEYVLPLCEKEGYEFLGWYETPTFVTEVITKIDSSFDYDVTVYARFKKISTGTYTITYNLDGGYFLEGDTPIYEYQSGDEFRLLEPEKDDYYFDGWYENADFSGKEIRFIKEDDAKDFVLYAKWESLYEVRQIGYDLDGGKFRLSDNAPSWYYEGKGIEIPEPVKKGYEFIGWYDNATGKTIYKLDSRAYGNKTLKALWEKIYTYSKINYVLNGGSIAEEVTTYPEEKGVTLPVPTRIGYFFRGYYLNSDFSGEAITEINAVQTGDVTVYAKWVEAKLENAYVSIYGDSISAYPGTVPEGYAAVIYPGGNVNSYKDMWWGQMLEATGATLLINNSYGATAVDGGTNQGIDDERVKLLAKDGINPDIVFIYFGINDVGNQKTIQRFETAYTTMINKIKKYFPSTIIFVSTLAYEKNTDKKTPGLREAFSEVIRKVANLTGCIAVEMCNAITTDNYLQTLYDSVHPNKKGMDALAQIAIDGVTTYFNNIKGYNINYDLDGGEFTTISYIKEYDKLLSSVYLPIPVKDGYKFLGWFDSENNKYDYIKAGSECDFNLKAKWEKIDKQETSCTVTLYDALGNTSVKNIKYGEVIGDLPLSNSTYQTVWMNDTVKVDSNYIVTSNLELHEVWVGVYEIINKTFPSVVFDDLEFNKTYSTSMGRINVTWSSSDKNTITDTGLVNPGRCEIEVVINARFQILEESQNYEFKVKVGKIEFRDLTNIKPVISYMHINMNELVVNKLVEDTLDIAVYSFSRVKSDFTVDSSELTQMDNVFRLRKHGVRVLLCLGAYASAGTVFSDCASTEEGRKTLAASILETIEKYHFDGVDIDWEYPGYQTGRDTSVDRPNYTLLMKEIYETVKAANSDYIVSAAIPGGIYGYVRYELGKLNNYLDYFNLMTYDLHSEGKVIHHSALYSGTYTVNGSCKQTVDKFVELGVDKNKLVVGAAFYGRMFYLTNTDTVLGNTTVTQTKAITFTNLYSNYISKLYSTTTKIERLWDDEAKAPIIVDMTNKIAITYDDSESVRLKCKYILDNNLGGIMFWSFGEDFTYTLLSAINDEMK